MVEALLHPLRHHLKTTKPLGGHLSGPPPKKIFSPPPPNSQQTPSWPPPPGRPPTSWDFQLKKPTPPPSLSPWTPHSPPPRRKNKKFSKRPPRPTILAEMITKQFPETFCFIILVRWFGRQTHSGFVSIVVITHSLPLKIQISKEFLVSC